jgi:Zn finger protein HypA/HybF involved in hydrogenase expression
MKDILIKFKKVHGELYDYSYVDYKDRLTKVAIGCKVHGEFLQTTAAHISGQGCPECGKIKRRIGKRITFDDFLIRAKDKHGNKFSYNKESYVDIEKAFVIVCPNHGEFTQSPKTHIKSHGCPRCGNNSASHKLSLTRQEFVDKTISVHGDKFIYDKVKYINNRTPIIITCKFHGDFNQKPNYHLSGNGCPKCGGTSKLSLEGFIDRSNLIHDFKYDYSKSELINSKKKVKIICLKHGEFMQSPSHHMMGSGCPTCNESKGEKLVAKILKEKSVNFVRQKRFKYCKNKAVLPFDFYLPDLNVLIEFDGAQHFYPWRLKDTEVAKLKLKKTQENDLIKTEFCKKNEIKLLRIRFDENVKNKLDKLLK